MKKQKKENKKNKNIEEENPILENNISLPKEFIPYTENQKLVYEAFERNYNLILSGAAGSGKTHISLAIALKHINDSSLKKKLIIVRSVVPTRDMGFLPGSKEEKESAYLTPYISLINKICESPTAFTDLIKMGLLEFLTTSFIRGITLNNAVIIVDEFQNCNFHELDSIITRVGNNSRIIFSGDTLQSDFTSKTERESVYKFLEILEKVKYFKRIEFTWEDCVRSSLVRDYLMTKHLISSSENENEKTQ